MTYSTAIPNDVAPFAGPRFPSGPARWRIVRIAVAGCGTVAVGLAISGWLATEFTPRETLAIAGKATADASGAAPLEASRFDLALSPANPYGADPYGALPGAVHTFEPLAVFTDPGAVPALALASPPSWLSTMASELASVSLTPNPAGAGTGAGNGEAASLAQAVPIPRREIPPQANRGAAPPSAPRPAQQATQQAMQQAMQVASAAAAPDNRGFFEKLFDVPQQPSGTALAYAQPEDGAIGSPGRPDKSMALPFPNSHTAIYDITARIVYMPNGDRLEAHSGIGDLLDDPAHVDAIDRGATPPHTYDLALRSELFHGVQALRLNPVGSGNMYGRAGFLVHPFMLDPNGDSNGCVSVKDYAGFLQAFLSGEVTRLVVVSHLGSAG